MLKTDAVPKEELRSNGPGYGVRLASAHFRCADINQFIPLGKLQPQMKACHLIRWQIPNWSQQKPSWVMCAHGWTGCKKYVFMFHKKSQKCESEKPKRWMKGKRSLALKIAHCFWVWHASLGTWGWEHQAWCSGLDCEPAICCALFHWITHILYICVCMRIYIYTHTHACRYEHIYVYQTAFAEKHVVIVEKLWHTIELGARASQAVLGMLLLTMGIAMLSSLWAPSQQRRWLLPDPRALRDQCKAPGLTGRLCRVLTPMLVLQIKPEGERSPNCCHPRAFGWPELENHYPFVLSECPRCVYKNLPKLPWEGNGWKRNGNSLVLCRWWQK